MTGYDLVVRNARLRGRRGLSDVAVHDGTIAAVGEVGETGDRELDAAGRFAFPGFVDCHVHMDKAFATLGADVPRYNDAPFSFERVMAAAEEYFGETPTDELTRRAVSNAVWALERGTRWIRSHATVGTGHGTAGVEAVVRAKELLRDVVDVEVVAYSETGVAGESVRADLERSVELGADLVGGMDPATTDPDAETGVERLFELASRLDVGVDSHVHEPGATGLSTIEAMIAATEAHDYGGRTTVSHGYALAHADERAFSRALRSMASADVSWVTCFSSTRPQTPLRSLLESDVRCGHGSDNLRDFVFPHGDADTLNALRTLALRLPGDPGGDDYRFFESNPGAKMLWDLATRGGASVLGLDSYGIEPGAPGNVVCVDAPTPEWAVLGDANVRFVVSKGRPVIENGALAGRVRDEIEARLGAPLIPRSPMGR